jgi:hypothetical protein
MGSGYPRGPIQNPAHGLGPSMENPAHRLDYVFENPAHRLDYVFENPTHINLVLIELLHNIELFKIIFYLELSFGSFENFKTSLFYIETLLFCIYKIINNTT